MSHMSWFSFHANIEFVWLCIFKLYYFQTSRPNANLCITVSKKVSNRNSYSKINSNVSEFTIKKSFRIFWLLKYLTSHRETNPWFVVLNRFYKIISINLILCCTFLSECRDRSLKMQKTEIVQTKYEINHQKEIF